MGVLVQGDDDISSEDVIDEDDVDKYGVLRLRN